MKEKKVFAFDWDGTSLNSTEVGYFKIEQTLKHLSLPALPREFLRVRWGMKALDLLEEICQEVGFTGRDNLNMFIATYKSHKESYDDNGKIAKSLIRLKNSGAKLALVTSRHHEGWLASCRSINFDPGMFDFIQTTCHYKHHKPSGLVFRPLLYWAKRHGYSPNEIVYFGDTVSYDYQATKNAQPQIDFVGIVSGVNTYEEFVQAGLSKEQIVPSFDELPLFLDKLIQEKVEV